MLACGTVDPWDEAQLVDETTALMERRLAAVTRHAPAFAACLRGYRRALVDGYGEVADGPLAWLGGSPTVSASIMRHAVRVAICALRVVCRGLVLAPICWQVAFLIKRPCAS